MTENQNLPKLTEDEMINIIVNANLSDCNLTEVMAYFSNNYDGLYDGKVLSEVFRRLK